MIGMSRRESSLKALRILRSGFQKQIQIRSCYTLSLTKFRSSSLTSYSLSLRCPARPQHVLTRVSSRSISNRPGCRELGETTLLMQEGTDIQEVPLAVLRSDPSLTDPKGQPKPFVELDPREEAAFVEGFSKFHTPEEVLGILDTIPSQEVTPVVALSILRKLFELENNFGFRNDARSWVIRTENSSVETFARMAIVSRLVDIIILGDQTSVVLEALDILRAERQVTLRPTNELHEDEYEEELNTFPAIPEFSDYRARLCEELLFRTAKGQVSLEEVCRGICSMGEMERQAPSAPQQALIDKMWAGIVERGAAIGLTNIVEVFRTVQYLRKSRRLVMNLVEKKCLTLWWRMEPSVVAEICGLLLVKEAGSSEYWGSVSTRLLMSLSRAISLNLHLVTEEDMLRVLRAFRALNFCDHAFEKALNKYMKAKCLKITNPALVPAVMDYVKKFRLRSAHTLNGAAEYLVLHNGKNLSGPQLASILEPFGLLDYQPPNGIRFWEIVERILQEKFVTLPPKLVLDLLLSCVYLQKYPLNFVDRVFSPYFLDRLHTSHRDMSTVQEARSRLKLLDTALSLECGSKYNGPHLPRDFTAKSLFFDGRILRTVNRLLQPLSTIFKPPAYKIEHRIVLPNLPLNELYIVDMMVSLSSSLAEGESESEPKPTTDILRNQFSLRHGRKYYVPIQPGSGNQLLAILINIPEHFSWDGKHLVGSQVMRVRHLRALGLHVVNLSHEHLAELYVTPQGLTDYLRAKCVMPDSPR